MWWVREGRDHTRGGFQNRDVGRTFFDKDFGPDYGIDYARFADNPDPAADAKLLERVNNRLFTDFAEELPQLEVYVRNGFVVLKGTVRDNWTKRAILDEVAQISGVEEVIHQLNVQELPQ